MSVSWTGKVLFPWNDSHECLGSSNLYLGNKIIASITLILVFLTKCLTTACTFILFFYTFLSSLLSYAFIQSNKNIIIWNCMVRCSENLVLMSYRSIFVNSSQNLIPWSCICNFSLVMSSDLGSEQLHCWVDRPCGGPFCVWSFEFSRSAVFIFLKKPNPLREELCFARALLNQWFSTWNWQEATVEKQAYCQ